MIAKEDASIKTGSGRRDGKGYAVSFSLFTMYTNQSHLICRLGSDLSGSNLAKCRFEVVIYYSFRAR
jgi:hypothetical protein